MKVAVLLLISVFNLHRRGEILHITLLLYSDHAGVFFCLFSDEYAYRIPHPIRNLSTLR